MIASMFLLSVLLGLSQATPSQTTPQGKMFYISPERWSYSCPENVRGADGLPLCSARYDSYPALMVARVDQGMTLTIPAKCRRAVNRFGEEVDVYNDFSVTVSLKADVAVQDISTAIVNYLSNLPHGIKRVCGKDYGKDRYEINDDDLQPMIEAVFINKKSPF
ncbi:hypothetical protein M0208_01950 [Sphingomonas sp. SUN019]|uniref:hypothetical protein n=1 Tax=Sphingomonas sp. SUN019 TaxID=2937788 RepID=UPI00216404CA|nr:hypothetical protein [Sphingomonas sp. SUN019]UVO49340.1 hypothetical protein M0208_01950 [Sphingomonas sp. SUN019]